MLRKAIDMNQKWYKPCPDCANEHSDFYQNGHWGDGSTDYYSNGRWCVLRTPRHEDWSVVTDTDRDCGECNGTGEVTPDEPTRYVVSFVSFAGNDETLNIVPEYDDTERFAARKAIAQVIRDLRNSGHRVSCIQHRLYDVEHKWESLAPDDAIAVPDTAGILSLTLEYDPVECRTCDGSGVTPETCGACCNELDVGGYCLRDSGQILCEDCADDAGAFKCPNASCTDGKIEVTHIEHDEMKGKRFALVGASCSMCGGRPHNPGERDQNGHMCDDAWFVVRAQMCDSDGIFFSYLCTDVDGRYGCLSDVLAEWKDVPADKRIKLETLGPLLEGDDDGLWSMMTD